MIKSNQQNINFASRLKIEQKLQISKYQFWKENQTDMVLVINKLCDSKSILTNEIKDIKKV